MADGTPTPLPAWIDVDLSEGLSQLVAGGERSDLEFKEEFPSQVRDLAKEIAAFATSGGGTVLIGVTDTGEIAGIPDGTAQTARAQLVQRVEGLCQNSIRPSPKVSCRFAAAEGQIVLAIEVPNGPEPVYYVGNVPYLRHITAARPADPQEVIDLVLTWRGASSIAPKETPEHTFLSSVAAVIVDAAVYADELEHREANPWLDEERWQLSTLAQSARDLAIDAPETLKGLVDPLKEMARHLDIAAHERISLGDGWQQMVAAARAAAKQSRAIKREWIDDAKPDGESIQRLRDHVMHQARRLADLCERLEEMEASARMDDIKFTFGEIGVFLLRAGEWDIAFQDSAETLRSIGRSLREIQIREIYSDGGQSVDQIVADIRENSRKLNALLNLS